MTATAHTCASCQFSATVQLDGRSRLECRRTPPVAVEPGYIPAGGGPGKNVYLYGRWPLVPSEAWCGEHRPEAK